MIRSSAFGPICRNGHILDPEWKICPYCPSGTDPASHAGAVHDERDGGTGSSLDATVDVSRTDLDASPGDVQRTVHIDGEPTLGHGRDVPLHDRLATTGPDPAADRSPRTTESRRRPEPNAAIGWLISLDLEGRGGMHPVDHDRVSIGTAPDSDVRIVSSHVSDRHAVVRCRGREFVLTDLDSTHGTFVNGERIRQRTLHDGDRVRFGSWEWIFKCVESDQ